MAATGVPIPVSDEREEIANDFRPNRRASQAGDLSYHPGLVALFAPPVQRQKWGHTQILPRTNWGDLFWDLFYVSAIYNSGNTLVASSTGTGALYYLEPFFLS